ncbi:MAG TPA: TRAP transporter large permease [Clostridia bacterium]|jgi:tripartite ATP-independent transporter DctM subunit|nr:TRAP transporter large permease [Clostridia bacterium]
MEMALLFGSLILLIAIGVPIGWAIGAACIITMAGFPDIPMTMITQNCFTGLNSFPLMAIPFFILSGTLMSSGGIAKKLLDTANAFFGFLTGGLALVSTASCLFFGAVSGSGVATTSAIGGFMIPEMKAHGYDEGFSSALVAAAGIIGVIIPPSIPFVIYAVTTGVSVSDMFIAGIIPGLLLGLVLMITSYFLCKKHGYGEKTNFVGFRQLFLTVWDAKWALIAPVIILGGIYSGIFTPTEASVVAVVYSFIIGRFVYRELDNRAVLSTIKDAAIISAVTTFLLSFSTTFATYITMKQLPQIISASLVSLTSNRIILLLLINIFLLVVGMLIDILPATMILAPILLPVAQQCGLTPIHFGMVMCVNLAIGFITPPYGINLFTACAISGLSIERVSKNIVYFLVALIAALLLITYIPGISTCLL